MDSTYFARITWINFDHVQIELVTKTTLRKFKLHLSNAKWFWDQICTNNYAGFFYYSHMHVGTKYNLFIYQQNNLVSYFYCIHNYICNCFQFQIITVHLNWIFRENFFVRRMIFMNIFRYSVYLHVSLSYFSI